MRCEIRMGYPLGYCSYPLEGTVIPAPCNVFSRLPFVLERNAQITSVDAAISISDGAFRRHRSESVVR